MMEGNLREPKNMRTERIVRAAGQLLDELISPQGDEQSVHRAPLQPCDASDLRNPQRGALGGECVQDCNGPIKRLDGLRTVLGHAGTSFRLANDPPAVHYHTNAGSRLRMLARDTKVGAEQ
jgi:hypothetical protein